MKKLALIILLALMASGPHLRSQDYVRYTDGTGTVKRIIRACSAYNNTEVIYSTDNVSGYIEFWKEGTGTCRIPVNLKFQVKDMKVHNNLLYFCGRYITTGFIAVVNLHDMFAHLSGSPLAPSNTTIHYTLLEEDFVTSLEKLVVYDDPAGPPSIPVSYADEHIAAIGKKGNALSYSDWVAVHLKYDNYFVGSSAPYIMGNVSMEVLEDLSCPHEELLEVLETDNYVAFVRYLHGTEEYVIHRCNKYDIAGTFNNICRYAATAGEVSYEVIATSMDNNNIALATTAIEITGLYDVRIRNIDLASTIMFNSQHISVGEVKQVLAMTYNRNTQKIVTMMDYPLVGGASDFIFLQTDPYNYNYSYSTYALSDNSQMGFYVLDDTYGPYFLALSANTWFRKRLLLTNSANNDCYKIYNISPQHLQTLDPSCMQTTTEGHDSEKEILRWSVAITDIETSRTCIIEEARNNTEDEK